MHVYTHTHTHTHTHMDILLSRAGPLVIGGTWGLARTIDSCCLCLPSIKQISKIHSEGVGGSAGPWGRVYKQVFPEAFPPMVGRPLHLVVSYISISSPSRGEPGCGPASQAQEDTREVERQL